MSARLGISEGGGRAVTVRLLFLASEFFAFAQATDEAMIVCPTRSKRGRQRRSHGRRDSPAFGHV